jgi:hypothetical protein
VESHEVQPGLTVQVREDRRRPELEGMQGIVRKCYGAPEYPALDVQLEDGQLELFWFHQLDNVNMDYVNMGSPIHSVPFYDGS